MGYNVPKLIWLATSENMVPPADDDVLILVQQKHQWQPIDKKYITYTEAAMMEQYVSWEQRLQKTNCYFQVKKIVATLLHKAVEDIQLFWEQGRLLVPNTGWHVSVSYSKHVFAIAIAKNRVGIDIEYIRPTLNYVDMAEVICSEKEGIAIANSGKPLEKYFEIFTRKEAYLKCIGIGLVDDLHHCCVANETVQYAQHPALQVTTIIENNYCISVAY